MEAWHLGDCIKKGEAWHLGDCIKKGEAGDLGNCIKKMVAGLNNPVRPPHLADSAEPECSTQTIKKICPKEVKASSFSL